MYTHVSIPLIKSYQLSRNYMYYVTHHNPFGLVLTAADEVNRRIANIIDCIITFL